MPAARYGSCAALGPDGRLWISHGFTADSGRFADTQAYDFAAGRWTDETPDGTIAPIRCLHDCLWTPDGRFVLYAGQTTGTPAIGDLWARGVTEGWTSLADGPPPRQLYALAAIGGTAYVFGGGAKDGGTLRDLWLLDLATLDLAAGRATGRSPERPVRRGVPRRPRRVAPAPLRRQARGFRAGRCLGALDRRVGAALGPSPVHPRPLVRLPDQRALGTPARAPILGLVRLLVRESDQTANDVANRRPFRCFFARWSAKRTKPPRATAAQPGRLNQKRVIPSRDSAPTAPPAASTIWRTIASPIPAPPLARSRDLSTR